MADQIKVIKQYNPEIIRQKIGFFRTLKQKWWMSDSRCLPAIVTHYDNVIHSASVLPLPKRVYQDENLKEIAENREEYTVPVLSFNHGSVSITCPIRVGDTGYLFACDRNCTEAISNNLDPIKESLDKEEVEKKTAAPDNGDICSFSNGFFVPCSWAADDSVNEDGEPNDKDEENAFVLKTVSEKPVKVIVRENGDDTYLKVKYGDVVLTIDKDGITVDAEKYLEYEFLTDIRYTASSHQIQKKSRVLKSIGNILYDPGVETDWTVMEGGQAVPVPVEDSNG